MIDITNIVLFLITVIVCATVIICVGIIFGFKFKRGKEEIEIIPSKRDNGNTSEIDEGYKEKLESKLEDLDFRLKDIEGSNPTKKITKK